MVAGLPFDNKLEYPYGVVGTELNYSKITYIRSYKVWFCKHGVKIPSNMMPILSLRIYDSDMQVVRFLDHNMSLSDPNLYHLFHEVNGE